MATPREKFQALLKKLFQFDNAELDFGIYRIMDLAADNIRVNAVCPGIVMTPLVERNLGLHADREAAYQRYISRNLMKRFGTAEEVADAVLFLSCDESTFITGSALSMDGGSVFH